MVNNVVAADAVDVDVVNNVVVVACYVNVAITFDFVVVNNIDAIVARDDDVVVDDGVNNVVVVACDAIDVVIDACC